MANKGDVPMQAQASITFTTDRSRGARLRSAKTGVLALGCLLIGAAPGLGP